MNHGQSIPGRTYVKAAVVRKKLGDIGQAAFGNIRQDPNFPKPFQLSPGVLVWDAAEIDAYVESLRHGEPEAQQRSINLRIVLVNSLRLDFMDGTAIHLGVPADLEHHRGLSTLSLCTDGRPLCVRAEEFEGRLVQVRLTVPDLTWRCNLFTAAGFQPVSVPAGIVPFLTRLRREDGEPLFEFVNPPL